MKKETMYHICMHQGQVGRYVLLPGDPGRVEIIASFLDEAREIASNREFHTMTGMLEGIPVSVTSTGIGGPSLAIAVEELVRIGADTFIRVGTCGGMSTDVLPGDLVIATGAIRSEGTSREYMPLEFPAVADFGVVNALTDATKELGCRYHVGIVQGKDSFYGQHEPERMPVRRRLLDNWQAWIDGGCLASEMESPALFVIASTLHVRAGSINLCLGNQERRKLGLKDPDVEDEKLAARAGILAVRKLIARDALSLSSSGDERRKEAAASDS